MIVVPVKEGENIEKALKKFKTKFDKTRSVKELRSRQQFDNPSVTKRHKKERGVYVQQLQQVEELSFVITFVLLNSFHTFVARF